MINPTTLYTLLNTPLVKEGIKNTVSLATFSFGIIEAHDLYQIFRGREISTETENASWTQVAKKMVILTAKISLVLSAAVSRPGMYLISNLSGAIFSIGQLDRLFGPNTVFAINPFHPRHFTSLAAVALAMPSFLHMTYHTLHWAYRQLNQIQLPSLTSPNQWLTDSKVRLMALFNTISSRPVLHWGNQLGRWFILRSRMV